MRTEPELDCRALRQHVQACYGLALERLAFLPLGEVSTSYLAHDGRGHAYVVRLYPQTSRMARWSVQRMPYYLPLLDRLQRENPPFALPRPVLTLAGSHVSRWDGYHVVITHYIDGRHPEPGDLYGGHLAKRLAETLAWLHQLPREVVRGYPFCEQFDIPFASELEQAMARLGVIGEGARPGQVALRDLLWPRRAWVYGMLEKLRGLAAQARALDSPLVLCHTDVHALNLLVDDAGRLAILDWEGAGLAPAEHDLFMFCGPGFRDFLRLYWASGGVRDLHPTRFMFYFYRRNLEDLTDWLVRILWESQTEEQDQLDLQGIMDDCVSRWPHMEATMSEVTDLLGGSA